MRPSSPQRLLLSGQSYRNFIETVHSPYTRISYRNSLQLYLRHRNVSGSCEELLQGDPRLIQSQIIDYVIHPREELNLSSSTINNRVAAVKKFYETNDIELKWRKIKSYIGKGKGARKKDKKDRAYTHDEIQGMLEKADQRGRISIF
jgi:integrase